MTAMFRALLNKFLCHFYEFRRGRGHKPIHHTHAGKIVFTYTYKLNKNWLFHFLAVSSLHPMFCSNERDNFFLKFDATLTISFSFFIQKIILPSAENIHCFVHRYTLSRPDNKNAVRNFQRLRYSFHSSNFRRKRFYFDRQHFNNRLSHAAVRLSF